MRKIALAAALALVCEWLDAFAAEARIQKLTFASGGASSINKEVWAFLQQQKLAVDPHFQQYQFTKQ